MSVRLLLVRHGRVDFESGVFRTTARGRQWDPPLGEQGLEQARSLAARLEMMDPPARIVVSPFQRCRQTIEPFVHATGLVADVVEDVGEVSIGAWEGVRFEDIISGDEELARRFREQEAMFSMSPGGESGEQLRSRVVPAVEAALEGIEDGTVVIVTHGGVINAYLGHVMGIARDMFFLPDNASINTVRADGGCREMRFLNDVRHLTDPQAFAPNLRVGILRGPQETSSRVAPNESG
jgi:probable phosphoglycerate mutase